MSRVARKSLLVKTKAGSLRERENIPSVIDYASMSRDELVEHFIDEGGLARFIDAQQIGVDTSEWDWRIIARDLIAFSRYLTFSPDYLQELYERQSSIRSEC